MIKKVDHIAIAVADLEEAIHLYRDVLGLDFDGSQTVEEQKVRVAFFRVGGVAIELLAPAAADSPISQFLEKKGSGLHHIALEVDDLPRSLDELKSRGAKLLDEAPRQGAHNAAIAFAHPKSFANVLIELKQSNGE